jgi:hypothetical protein
MATSITVKSRISWISCGTMWRHAERSGGGDTAVVKVAKRDQNYL